MTKQYVNLDKVELKRPFPDIVAMKDGGLENKKGLRGTRKKKRAVLKLWIYANYLKDYPL